MVHPLDALRKTFCKGARKSVRMSKYDTFCAESGVAEKPDLCIL